MAPTAALRAGGRTLPIVLAPIVLAACGGSGGGGGSQPESYWVSVDGASTSVAAAEIDLRGSASCDACPETEVGFGFCPTIQGPIPSSIEIVWSNRTTGQQGNALHVISGDCACLFSYCWVSYGHTWLVTVPLVMGPNVIEIAAFGPSSLPGSETLTITRTPPAPGGVAATAREGEIELRWDPVADADSYDVYWSETREVSSATAHRIPDAISPFRHLGLADDVTVHYAVSAVSRAQEGPLSGVVWATAGWPTEALPMPAGSSVYADTALATDALDHVHVHQSRRASSGSDEENDYGTDSTGTWVSSAVALASWRDADIALDSTGTVHLSYLRPEGLVHAWGSAGSWSTEVVDALGTCDASLAVDASDRLHLAYRAASTPAEVRYASNVSGAWLVERVEAADLGCSSGVSVLSLAVQGDGTPHVAYAGASPGLGLHHATKRAGVWNHDTIDAAPVGRSSLALAADGTPHVAYIDGQFVLRHARREVSGAWTIERVDEEAFVDTPSLALDTAGNAHVSYLAESYGGELRYATNTGGAWRVVRVAPATYADTALAVDLHGWVHISYFDADDARYATRR